MGAAGGSLRSGERAREGRNRLIAEGAVYYNSAMSLAGNAAARRDVDVEAAPASASVGQVSSAECLEIAGQLLAALDLATGAGQAHLMRRILRIIREEIRWPTFWLTDGPLATVRATTGDLEHEVARRAPDPKVFRGLASGLLELLSASALSRRPERSTRGAAVNGSEGGRSRS
jgi:hypothetical protein